MLANTLSITIGSESARVLERFSEANGVSKYRYRVAGEETLLTLRANPDAPGAVKENSYNLSIVQTKTDVEGLKSTWTASMTGRFPGLGDPTASSKLTKALAVLGATIMDNLAAGVV